MEQSYVHLLIPARLPRCIQAGRGVLSSCVKVVSSFSYQQWESVFRLPRLQRRPAPSLCLRRVAKLCLSTDIYEAAFYRSAIILFLEQCYAMERGCCSNGGFRLRDYKYTLIWHTSFGLRFSLPPSHSILTQLVSKSQGLVG